MGFNEKTHAFIAAKYYVRLNDAFGERGKAAFLHATRYYAEQRGRRMAQRAIRDGEPLTYETYCRYGEWVNTEEIKAAGQENKTTIASMEPDYEMHIFACPWHAQFKEMGLSEAGLAYCRDLDASICRGFNPELVYEVSQTLHDHDFCIQTVRNAGIRKGSNLAKKPEGLKSFEYHCAHSYWAYHEVTAAIFGEEGERVNKKVLEDFAKEYGSEMADTLAGYCGTNFNII
jgi:hypothetical protein